MSFFPWVAAGAFVIASSFTSWFTLASGPIPILSLGFLTMVFVFCSLMFVFIDNDEGAGALGTVVLFVAMAYKLVAFDFSAITRISPLRVVGWAALYFLIGTAWSVAKWWFHVRESREIYEEKKAEFIRNRQKYSKASLEEIKKEWPNSSSPSKPVAAESKEMILRWMSFWPWSMGWTLLNDPIKKAFRAIYRRIQGRLQAMSDKAWEGAE